MGTIVALLRCAMSRRRNAPATRNVRAYGQVTAPAPACVAFAVLVLATGCASDEAGDSPEGAAETASGTGGSGAAGGGGGLSVGGGATCDCVLGEACIEGQC